MGKAETKRLGILIDDRTIRVAEISVFRGQMTLQAGVSLISPATDEAALVDTLKKALQQLNFPAKSASLAISDRSLLFELVTIPQLKPNDRAKVMERNALRIAAGGKGSAADIQFGYRKTRNIEKGGSTQEEYLLCATSKATVQRFTTLCEKSGLEIESLVSLPEAIFTGLKQGLTLEGNEAYLVVDFESSYTHVVLLTANGWMFSRDLAKSIDATRALSEVELKAGRLGIDTNDEVMILHDEKENEKGSAFGTEPPPQALPLPPLLLGEIKRTIQFLEREHSLKINKIFFSGILRPEDNLLDELSKHLERAAFWFEDSRIKVSHPHPVFGENYPLPYALPISAIQASDETGGINLLPPELRPQKGLSTRRTLILTTSAVMVAIALGFSAFIWLQLPEYEKMVAQTKPIVQRVKEDESRPVEGAEEIAVIHDRQDNLNLLKKSQSPASFVLHEISKNIPAAIALTEMKVFRHGEKWIFRCAGRVKNSKGNLEDVPSFQQLIRSLERSPLFESLEFTPIGQVADPSATAEPSTVEKPQFRLEAYIKGIV